MTQEMSSATTPIMLNDFRTQWQAIGKSALSAVERVGNSGWLILGDEVKKFEAQLAEYWGLPYAIGCGNGLDALEIALHCLSLPKGAKVLTTPLTAFATTLAIIRAGGVPVFVDVDASGLIDLTICEEVLAKHPDIRYFMPVHLYGHAISHTDLLALKQRFDLFIIEDCAQAIGAKSAEIPVGLTGQIAATSFYPTKNLGALGDGGALLTASQEYADIARSLRDYGQTDKYRHSRLGLNSRLDELQAAILNDALLPNLTAHTLRRKQIARRYQQEITNPYLQIPPAPEQSDSVWHLFPVLVSEQREAFQAHLKNARIQTAVHYPALSSQQPALTQENIAFMQLSALSQAEYFTRHEVSLPVHPYLTEQEIDRVIQACHRWKP